MDFIQLLARHIPAEPPALADACMNCLEGVLSALSELTCLKDLLQRRRCLALVHGVLTGVEKAGVGLSEEVAEVLVQQLSDRLDDKAAGVRCIAAQALSHLTSVDEQVRPPFPTGQLQGPLTHCIAGAHCCRWVGGLLPIQETLRMDDPALLKLLARLEDDTNKVGPGAAAETLRRGPPWSAVRQDLGAKAPRASQGMRRAHASAGGALLHHGGAHAGRQHAAGVCAAHARRGPRREPGTRVRTNPPRALDLSPILDVKAPSSAWVQVRAMVCKRLVNAPCTAFT